MSSEVTKILAFAGEEQPSVLEGGAKAIDHDASKPRTVVGIIKDVFDWYPSHLPAEERKLLRKLDVSILVYACLSFFVKYLDQTNVTNAYVSGMKEDLALNGNQLNYLTMVWTGAYVLFQIPSLMLMSRPSLCRWWLPLNEIAYGILTFCESRVSNVQQLYALRFLLGAFEAPTFAGTHFVLGSWYRPNELFKRAGAWFICNSMGSMVSGYLQAATYSNLDGVSGLSGWRWLFIIDGVITMPIAVLGLLTFPGVPEGRKTFFFSEEEIALAKKRMASARARGATKLNLDVFKRTLRRWRWWVACAIYIFLIQSSYGAQYMALWLKSLHTFSVPQINAIPSSYYVVSALSSWLGTTLAPVLGEWTLWTVAEALMLFDYICFAIWNVPYGLKFFCWISLGVSGCISPILYSFINIICREDAEERALVMSSMMTLGYSTQIWIPLFTFPTVKAPRWLIGWTASIGFLITMWLLQSLAVVLSRRDECARREADDAAPSPGASDEGDVKEADE